ncbi:MAG TPA: hypothetical protein VE090_00235 [Methylomirabilota bacterium]|nr:hypothetical protein [Methylomirabilota bacterium]
MLPALLFQITNFLLNLVIVLFLIFYLIKLRVKEKAVEEKTTKIDTNYHQVVDDALSKERKILADATFEADKIITDAKYVNTSSKTAIDHALSKMIDDINNETVDVTHDFKKSYIASLTQVSSTSVTDFEKIMKGLETDLQKQLKEFHETLLPNLEKELESYKQARIKQTEQTIIRVIQEASQEILNKTISLNDHQHLVIQSLEKVKQEGGFE